MIDFWDVLKRSENGKLMEEREFDLLVGKTAKKIQLQHQKACLSNKRRKG